MIKYPNGQAPTANKNIENNTNKRHILNAANRGMSFENDINITNQYYKDNNIAIITKRPTPINVVKVDYSRGSLITKAYFEKQSTTDFNGVYKGRYIDFEAKSVDSKSSLPLSNISSHQISHLQSVISHGGIAFFLIEFRPINEVYLLSAQEFINFINNEKRKSIPLSYIKEKGYLVEQGYLPRYDFIKIVKNYLF